MPGCYRQHGGGQVTRVQVWGDRHSGEEAWGQVVGVTGTRRQGVGRQRARVNQVS